MKIIKIVNRRFGWILLFKEKESIPHGHCIILLFVSRCKNVGFAFTYNIKFNEKFAGNYLWKSSEKQITLMAAENFAKYICKYLKWKRNYSSYIQRNLNIISPEKINSIAINVQNRLLYTARKQKATIHSFFVESNFEYFYNYQDPSNINSFLAKVPIFTSRKHQKTFGFLVFSRGIKWKHWSEMG